MQDIDTGIHFIGGGENKGAGANRNRILGALGYDALIHFIDADTTLDTTDTTGIIKQVVPDEPFGFIGGLAKTTEGLQTVWNYGPRQTLWSFIGARVQIQIEPLLLADPEKAREIMHKHRRLLEDWPNPLEEPVRRQVFWVVEQNFVVDSRVFATAHGFDESLREHKIQDLAIRMSKLGLKRYFDPSFVVTHQAVNVREYDRDSTRHSTELKIARKHGLVNWLLPDGRIKPRL